MHQIGLITLLRGIAWTVVKQGEKKKPIYMHAGAIKTECGTNLRLFKNDVHALIYI